MLIATRVLKLKKLESEIAVPIRLYAPTNAGLSWACRIEISWPSEPFELDVHGEDAIQALDLALKTLGAAIYASDHHATGKLVWLEHGRGYGFPVMNNMRDMLVGDDKKFF